MKLDVFLNFHLVYWLYVLENKVWKNLDCIIQIALDRKNVYVKRMVSFFCSGRPELI